VLVATRRYHAVLHPLAVYALSRALFLAITATGPQFATPHPPFTSFVVRWDATYYLNIVRHGYPRGAVLAPEHAFFPLYPLTVRVADVVLPGGDFVASVSVSLVAGAVATVLLWRAASILGGARVADRTALVFVLFPGTIVFGWPYADALLLAFMCVALCMLLEGRWVAATAAAALAGATRPSGLVLVAACAWVAFDRSRGPDARRALAAVAAAVGAASGFLAYLIWLWRRTGDARHWFRVERDVFGEGTPWKRLPTTIADIFRDGPQFNRLLVVACVVLAAVMLVVGITARQPGWAKLITVLALYLAVTANIASASPRLQLAAVPAFIALGSRLRDETLVWWCVASVAFATMLIFVYGLTINVAP
jgi:Mannosyltransferase (PIG-V)